MARFFVPASEWPPLAEAREVTLPSAEAHHAVGVLRLTQGEMVTVMDGAGRSVSGPLLIRGKKAAAVGVDTIVQTERPPGKLSLAVAIPKGSTMEWIIEKAVELGCDEVFPLVTERTISRPKGDDVAAKQSKWQRVALETCKQCGQLWLPHIHAPTAFEPWLRASPGTQWDSPLIASLEPGTGPLAGAQAGRSCLLIGPEGDFTPAEYAIAREGGWRAVSLGPLVLRVETAALFGLSVLTRDRRMSN